MPWLKLPGFCCLLSRKVLLFLPFSIHLVLVFFCVSENQMMKSVCCARIFRLSNRDVYSYYIIFSFSRSVLLIRFFSSFLSSFSSMLSPVTYSFFHFMTQTRIFICQKVFLGPVYIEVFTDSLSFLAAFWEFISISFVFFSFFIYLFHFHCHFVHEYMLARAHAYSRQAPELIIMVIILFMEKLRIHSSLK